MSSSWNDDSSHTTMPSSGTSPAMPDSATPTLPATIAAAPAACSIAPTSSVTVVLPLVPVMPTSRAPAGSSR